jgi:predicted dehydrogenase
MNSSKYHPNGRYRRAGKAVSAGDFIFAAAALDHGHIGGMCAGLIEAGATLKTVYDSDRAKAEAFAKAYGASAAESEDQILCDPEVMLVASAAVPSERWALGIRAMDAGKDYFVDKAPFTTLSQLEAAKKKAAETGRKYIVYYSERIHSEAGVYAGYLIDEGAVGKVINVMGLGPHRLGAPARPDWFFKKERYGGILCDIGSHQIEQYLYYSGADDAAVTNANAGNYAHPEYPELEDFGEASLTGDNGTTNYFRVDWFTPAGLSSWGDGRTVILGTDGYIEMRKYVNIGTGGGGNNVFLVNGDGEFHIMLRGEVGYPFFGDMILDCLNRTEKAMTQKHAFKAAELSLQAHEFADGKRIGFTNE